MGVIAEGAVSRVLLVDDEEDLVWSISNRLGKVRPRLIVDTAHSGEEALEKMRATAIDLLVADVRMPGMSGLELVAHTRNTTPGLPVIIMTAYGNPEVRRVASSVSTTLLEKPFEFDDLVDQVDSALASARGFSGAVSVQTLPEIVQLYVLSMATGVLEVRRRGREGALYFDAGQIVHAVTSDGMTGEPAFQAVMQWTGGEFALHLGARPSTRSITCSWTELLMESARLLDEGRRSEQPVASRAGWTLMPPPSATTDDDFDFDLTTQKEAPPGRGKNDKHMAHEKELAAAIDQFAIDIPGFIAASLVDSDSGMTLAARSNRPDFDLAVASAYNSELVKQKLKIMKVLNLKTTLEDMILTLGDQIHFIKVLSPTTFIYLAADRSASNIAIVRSVVSRHLNALHG